LSITLAFRGDYDFSCRATLRAQLAALNSEPNVTLDLSGATYVDASFFSELVRLHRNRQAHGLRTETIVVRSALIKKLFTVLALDRVFRIVDAIGTPVVITGDIEAPALRRDAFTCTHDDVAPLHQTSDCIRGTISA
jgi:anti-anti-sigma regulatory factor